MLGFSRNKILDTITKLKILRFFFAANGFENTRENIQEQLELFKERHDANGFSPA